MKNYNKETLKKFSGIASALTSGVLIFSGCGIVGNIDNEKFNYSGCNISSVNNLEETISNDKDPVTTTTIEEPFAYAGSNYKDPVTTTTTEEPFAYAGSNYKDPVTTTTTEEPFAYAGSNYKDPVTTTTIEEPFAYAGSGYKNHLEEIASIIKQGQDGNYSFDTTGKYAYLDCYGYYTLRTSETVETVCNMFNITTSQFEELNPSATLNVGDIIKYPIKAEFYIASSGESLDSIAVINGIDISTIKSDNNYGSDDNYVETDSYIFLHAFYGNTRSYETNIGVSNVIYNNKIIGDKVVHASGFAGANQKVLVLNNSRFVYETNTVTCYQFDCNNNYTSNIICSNAKDINSIDGIPVIYFRNDEDIANIASQINLPDDEIDLMQWTTNNFSNYTVNYDEFGNAFITYNGIVINDNNVKTR